MPKKTFSIRLDDETLTSMSEEAAERGLDVSDVVRDRLRDRERLRCLKKHLPRSVWREIERMLAEHRLASVSL